MAQNAGWKGKAKHATTLGGSYTAILGVNSISVSRSRAELDTSAFADNDGWKRFILGLGEIGVELGGDRIAGDTQQDALQTALLDGTTVFLQVLPDGTNGFKGEFIVTKFDPKPDMSGKDTFSASLKLTGAPTAVP